MNNLSKRVLSGLVLFLLLVLIIYAASSIDSKIGVYAIALITLVIFWEFYQFFEKKVIGLIFLLSPILSITLISNLLLDNIFSLIIISCLTWALMAIRIIIFDNPKMNNIELFVLGYLIIFPAFTSATWIYVNLSPSILLLIVFGVSIADTSAYFVGKKLGNTQLLANTSPGKTLEGLIGACVITPISLALIAFFLDYQFIGFFIFGLILTPISFIGDIVFSYVKRCRNKKDSSNLIPGHGGFIDLLDGTIAVLTFFWMFAAAPTGRIGEIIYKNFLIYLI
jgi:phosphatidate cytidylyltransferase|tara:strand:+ start:814 stop:1656 length:843 start_codon:yes stop_codon:yes gene_type:complete